eukprot:TRINITY_DN250_c0_g1_i1.p1 TRINITY_DN250_c0_g1~~TRINITY_DN250_c0_g1_i1.p1  ORF type:complete len:746 (+),score=247.04 TRINITY_DN250_c0_g1_i1:228-2240(+)
MARAQLARTQQPAGSLLAARWSAHTGCGAAAAVSSVRCVMLPTRCSVGPSVLMRSMASAVEESDYDSAVEESDYDEEDGEGTLEFGEEGTPNRQDWIIAEQEMTETESEGEELSEEQRKEKEAAREAKLKKAALGVMASRLHNEETMQQYRAQDAGMGAQSRNLYKLRESKERANYSSTQRLIRHDSDDEYGAQETRAGTERGSSDWAHRALLLPLDGAVEAVEVPDGARGGKLHGAGGAAPYRMRDGVPFQKVLPFGYADDEIASVEIPPEAEWHPGDPYAGYRRGHEDSDAGDENKVTVPPPWELDFRPSELHEHKRIAQAEEARLRDEMHAAKEEELAALEREENEWRERVDECERALEGDVLTPVVRRELEQHGWTDEYVEAPHVHTMVQRVRKLHDELFPDAGGVESGDEIHWERIVAKAVAYELRLQWRFVWGMQRGLHYDLVADRTRLLYDEDLDERGLEADALVEQVEMERQSARITHHGLVGFLDTMSGEEMRAAVAELPARIKECEAAAEAEGRSLEYGVVQVEAGTMPRALDAISLAISAFRNAELPVLVVHRVGEELDEIVRDHGRTYYSDTLLAWAHASMLEENLEVVQALRGRGIRARPVQSGMVDLALEEAGALGTIGSVPYVDLYTLERVLQDPSRVPVLTVKSITLLGGCYVI